MLIRKFRKDPDKYWKVELFKQKGFERRKCSCCDKYYWTLDPDRKTCGDPPCENYGFIGKPITKVKWDYVQTWKAFEKFFMKNGHASVPRYPVIDRWRPDLYFTIASIQDFQRLEKGNMVFEYPDNPLVVPQVCLRFPDIQNVGVTGRHHTSFIMSGQHAFGHPNSGYFKDRCLELNFEFLNKAMGIPEKELTYVESFWAMPDLSAFGPSMETISRGLELVNSVFMQFTKTGPSSFRDLPIKVIDVGWGHERLVWFSQGTHTGYDAVFGPVIEKLKSKAGLRDSDILDRYAALSASLDLDEAGSIKKIREKLAKQLGVSVKELVEVVEPSQALYAITDHVKTLLFAIADGGIPSNVGGGYNLRVLLRRMYSFINDYNFDIDPNKVAELHTNFLKPMFPELSSGLDSFAKIADIEKKRYEKTLEKAGLLIQRELKSGSGKLDTDTMSRLYTSNGITPELVEKVAKDSGQKVEIPEDFYAKLTEQHMSGERKKEDVLRVDVSGLEKTRMLFYEKPYQKVFKAKVLAVLGEWVVLDRTTFYAEGGGQLSDKGSLRAGVKEFKVTDVQKLEDVVLHKVDVKGLAAGQEVSGELDWERRHSLMKMHSCAHIVAGATRRLIGSHVWQAGAKKGLEVSRVDFTHYKPFTHEEIREIEKIANDIVRKSMPVSSKLMDRGEAEKAYGFTLYQGGASPGKQIRVVNTANGFDVEACGGTHLKNTGEVELIKIIRTERIQDGVNRLEFTCGRPAFAYLDEQEGIAKQLITLLKGTPLQTKAFQSLKTEGDVAADIQAASSVLSVEPRTLAKTFERFVRELKEDHDRINKLRKTLELEPKNLDEEVWFQNHGSRPGSIQELSEQIFFIWKDQKKALESLTQQSAGDSASRLVRKARDNRILEIVPGDRKTLIEMANQALKTNPELMVILANQAGDIVCMSRSGDASASLKEILTRSGGTGGGNKQLAQGRVELSKLMKIINKG